MTKTKTRCPSCRRYAPRCDCAAHADRQAAINVARALVRAGQHAAARAAFAALGISYAPAFEVV